MIGALGSTTAGSARTDIIEFPAILKERRTLEIVTTYLDPLPDFGLHVIRKSESKNAIEASPEQPIRSIAWGPGPDKELVKHPFPFLFT
jgi:hypothetical protein